MSNDQSKYHIVVVEDNLGDFILVEDYLAEHLPKTKLSHFTNYSSFQSFLNQSKSKEIDLLLLDLSLPDIGKDELINEAEKIGKIMPVIILTGYSDLDFATKSLSIGITDYLIKDTINSLVLYKSVIYSLERHRFLQTLRTSEQRYMNLFNLNPAPIWVYDLHSLEFLDVNEAAVKHYGYSREEFSNMSVKDLFPHYYLPKTAKIHEAFNKKSDKNVVQHQKKNGDIIFVEIISNRFDYKGSEAKIVLATDVTHKRLQVEAIKAQNQKLREIAWTQSHVVRAPVARLMGIIDLIKSDPGLSEEELQELMDSILHSAEEIDQTIHKIAKKSKHIKGINPSMDNQNGASN
ncbi:MAG: PAS domain S-box protein [Bacteroidota bacterium]